MASLPPDLEQFVHDQLAKGRYQSASDVLCDAVRLLREREVRLEALRGDIDRGITQLNTGEFVEIDSETALQWAIRLLKVAPLEVEARRQAGLILVRRGEHKSAEELLRGSPKKLARPRR